jgi:hypothetical protein
MSDQPQQPEVIDPDNIPETLCEGMFNVSFAGPNGSSLSRISAPNRGNCSPGH